MCWIYVCLVLLLVVIVVGFSVVCVGDVEIIDVMVCKDVNGYCFLVILKYGDMGWDYYVDFWVVYIFDG